MYYIIHFEYINNDKHLNITKFINEEDAINRLLQSYFNYIIISDPQRNIEENDSIENYFYFKYNIEELLEKYKNIIDEQEFEIFNKIKKYKKLYYSNYVDYSYYYISKMNEDDLVLQNYDFDELKRLF